MQSNSQKEEENSEHSVSPPQKRKKMNHNSSSPSNHQKMEIDFANSISKEISHFEKDEIVRIMLQTLHSWGYSKTIESLEKESGVLEQSKAASELCDSLMKGNWENVEKCIPSLHLPSRKEKVSVNFFIYKQKFLEMLENKKLPEAIESLRQIGALGTHEEEVQRLSTLILCLTPEELRARAEWDGSQGQSRSLLLAKLRELLPAKVLLPENRLESLLHQAQSSQLKACKYHNTLKENFSLLEDHRCTDETIPSQTASLLEKHDNEVWYVRYSNSGHFVASTGKDTSVIIWDIKAQNPKPATILSGHKGPISFLAFSRDDKLLLTCGSDNLVKLWNLEKSELLKTFEKHTENVMACAWFSDNKRFVTGGIDKQIAIMDITGKEIKTLTSTRVNDLALTNDNKTLIVICQEKKIHFIDMEDYSEEIVQEVDALTSLELSSDSKYLLVNTAASEIRMYNVKRRILKQKFRGHKQSRYVIRSCFAGAKNVFVVSGSEDSQVYIWHRRRGVLLYALEGHAGSVNCVSSSPHDIFSFVSCSDDKTIRLWRSPIALTNKKEEETTNMNTK